MAAHGIGDRIRERMDARGMEEIDLAAGVRVSQATVNRWVNGISDPRAENIPGIARVLDVTEHWLITGDERSLVEKLVNEMRRDGFDESEIVDALVGLQNAKRQTAASEERAAQPGDGRVVPLQSAEKGSQRPDGAAERRGRGGRDQQRLRRRRNPDEPPQS